MANKINEIIDVINSGGTGDYDSIVERLDTIDSEIDVTSEFPNQKINSVVLNNADNIDALYEITEREIGKVFNYVENWTIISNESDIFDTVDGKKYFKHDTFLYYNGVGSGISGYFIKGFPKDKIRINFTYVDSDTNNDFTYVYDDLYVNNDTFKFVEETSTYEFDQTPPRTNYNRELRDVEYGTSYNDTGDYGKIIMFVRNIGS